MDILLLFLWFFVAVGFLLSLIGCAYFTFLHETDRIAAAGKIVLGFGIYLCTTVPTGFFAGIALFLKAHSNGAFLGNKEVSIGFAVLVLYFVGAWLTCFRLLGRTTHE